MSNDVLTVGKLRRLLAGIPAGCPVTVAHFDRGMLVTGAVRVQRNGEALEIVTEEAERAIGGLAAEIARL